MKKLLKIWFYAGLLPVLVSVIILGVFTAEVYKHSTLLLTAVAVVAIYTLFQIVFFFIMAGRREVWWSIEKLEDVITENQKATDTFYRLSDEMTSLMKELYIIQPARLKKRGLPDPSEWRNYRDLLEMSQQQVAEKVGININVIARAEAGGTKEYDGLRRLYNFYRLELFKRDE